MTIKFSDISFLVTKDKKGRVLVGRWEEQDVDEEISDLAFSFDTLLDNLQYHEADKDRRGFYEVSINMDVVRESFEGDYLHLLNIVNDGELGEVFKIKRA